MSKSINYKKSLNKRLKNSKEAAAYLNAALEDEDIRVFLVALRDVTEAYGGISYLAKETDLNRESLYRTLSLQGNPTIINDPKVPKKFSRSTTLTLIDSDNVSIASSVRWKRTATYSKPIIISIIRTR